MPVSCKQQAYEHIRRKLMTGAAGAGSQLSEVALAKEIGLSRTPVREAISQLESEGLVEQIPRFGAFVRILSGEEIAEIFDLRLLLEAFAVSRAAERASEADLVELRAALAEMRGLVRQVQQQGVEFVEGDMAQRWLMLDVAFHMLVMRIAGSPRIMKIVSDFRIMTGTFVGASGGGRLRFPPRPARIYGEHARIVRAIAKRDAEQARQAITRHLQDAGARVMAHCKEPKLNEPVGAGSPAELLQLVKRMERYQASSRAGAKSPQSAKAP